MHNHVHILHLTDHLANTPQSLKEKFVGDYSNASCLQHTDSSQNLTTTLNHHDHLRREELTLEQQHHGDRR